MKEGGGGGEGRKPSFLPRPSPPRSFTCAIFRAPFFARSLTLAPRSLLLNRAETLAAQAREQSPGLPYGSPNLPNKNEL